MGLLTDDDVIAFVANGTEAAVANESLINFLRVVMISLNGFCLASRLKMLFTTELSNQIIERLK